MGGMLPVRDLWQSHSLLPLVALQRPCEGKDIRRLDSSRSSSPNRPSCDRRFCATKAGSLPLLNAGALFGCRYRLTGRKKRFRQQKENWRCKAERVNAVEHTAMAHDERAVILNATIPFDGRHRHASGKSYQRDDK